MKHHVLICLLALCAFRTGLAQSADFASTYYPYINQAELAIISEDYTTAVSHYKKAFSAVKNGFARDYRNAVLCGIQTQDDPFAFALLEKIALKGVGKKYFEDSAFVPLQGKREWRILMQSLDRLQKEFVANSSQPLRKELEAMHERDQFFRVKEGSYDVYGDTIAKIDFENVTRFRQMVKETGFPTEEMIGAFNQEKKAPFYIVLHHHAQTLSQEEKKYPRAASLSPEIIAATKAGQCPPALAGFLLSMENNPSLNYGAWGVNRLRVNGVLRPHFLLDKHTDDLTKTINERRAAIGLESLEEFREKCQYWLDHPDKPFVLSCHMNVNIWEMEEAMANDFEGFSIKLEPRTKK